MMSENVAPQPVRNRRRRLGVALAALLLTLAGAVGAQAADQSPSAPDSLMRQTSEQMFSALQEHRGQLKNDPTYVYTLVNEVLVPHVDFNRASHWVLGRYWRKATPEQRQRFIKEFKTLLVRFYSNALAEYAQGHEIDHNMITFLPFRADDQARDVTVRSLVHQPNGSSVAVNYELHRDAAGWKVYDVTVEGISMVTTYRSSFAEEIRKGGIDGLIHTLSERNRKLLARGAPST
ncbi:MAG: ABC transporter substrate-binding protein [Gammaproteobacteria bacterium]